MQELPLRSFSATKLARPKSLTDLVVECIKEQIVDGRLSVGQPLSENALAAELGISKTPVREGLLQLKMQGLVEIRPQRGSYVFSLDDDSVAELCELRAVLELAALRLALASSRGRLVHDIAGVVARMDEALAADDLAAYRRLDAEFHQSIVNCGGNRFLIEAYEAIALKVQALRTRLSVSQAHIDASIDQHRTMLGHVRSGEDIAAETLLARHIDNTKRSYVSVLRGGPPVDVGKATS
jgi:DNA-binding GntR family transcriptional regulator